MDNPKTTPKDFFLWAGAMVALYWTVIASIFLIFNYINFLLPDALNQYPSDPYQSGISYQMASLIVLLPIYLILMWAIRKDVARDSSRKGIWVRKWAILLTLFIAGATMAVDLIVLLNTFLSGEALTLAFVLKVLVIFAVAAKIFVYFIAELKGYWDKHRARRRAGDIGFAVFGVALVVAGFLIVGTPGEARVARFDEQKVMDLQNIQSQIITYWQAKQKLPAALTDLNNSLSYSGPLPLYDAQTGKPYAYEVAGPLTFKLCAEFNGEGRDSYYNGGFSRPQPLAPVSINDKPMQDNWQHGAGLVCFDRTIDPSFYPPFTKLQP